MLPRLPTVMVKYCLLNHYNAHHMQFTKKIIIIKPEPDIRGVGTGGEGGQSTPNISYGEANVLFAPPPPPQYFASVQ